MTQARRGDDGFTVIEAVVSIVIASGVLLAVAFGTIAGVQATLASRQNQQAGDLLTQTLEDVRAKPYASLAMTSNPTGSSTYDPGTGTAEPLVVAATGTVQPETQVTRNRTVYTVDRYVTLPPDTTGATYKRVTVVVTWFGQGVDHTRRSSSVVTATQRGLPLPRFSFATMGPQAQTKASETELIWAFRIINLGARDSWTLQADNGTWTYYADPGQEGINLDTSTATPLPTQAGQAVTPLLETNQSYFLVASRTVGAEEPPTTETRFTATSVAQPTATTASKSVLVTLTVDGPVSCPGCTWRTYTFHNSPPAGNTTTQTFAWMDTVSTVQAAVYNYSTEAGSGQGRRILPGGIGPTENNKTKVLDLRYQAPGAMTLGGTSATQADMQVYVFCASGGTANLTAYLGQSTSAGSLAGFTSQGSGSGSLSCTGSFAPLTLSVPVAAQFGVAKNKYLEVRLQLDSTSTTSDVRVLYDAPGYAATAVIPQTSP